MGEARLNCRVGEMSVRPSEVGITGATFRGNRRREATSQKVITDTEVYATNVFNVGLIVLRLVACFRSYRFALP
jgi:hypothetical protein